jgi:hypothetical protein
MNKSGLVALTLFSLVPLASCRAQVRREHKPDNICTLYASASGSDRNSGSAPGTPKTVAGAANATVPGSVVCMEGGNYTFTGVWIVPPHNGSAGNPITYQAYGDSPVNVTYTGGLSNYGALFTVDSVSYVTIGAIGHGFNFDGQQNAQDGIAGSGAGNCHHITVVGNHLYNIAGAGVAYRGCDYMITDHNFIGPHNGENNPSLSTSGITYNSPINFDTYAGIHSVISNNIVSGECDCTSQETDGNGIILDGDSGASTYGAQLVVNNVIYENGGRCVHVYNETSTNPNLFINNTCYANLLDTTMTTTNGSISVIDSSHVYILNNISQSWYSGSPSYWQSGSSNITYSNNLYYIGAPHGTPVIAQGNPLFVSPPGLSTGPSQSYPAAGQYANALDPTKLGNDLQLQPGSPARGAAIDPSTLAGLNPSIASDLRRYIYTDINGNPRPQGSHFDLGAYQTTAASNSSGSSPQGAPILEGEAESPHRTPRTTEHYDAQYWLPVSILFLVFLLYIPLLRARLAPNRKIS